MLTGNLADMHFRTEEPADEQADEHALRTDSREGGHVDGRE